MNGDKGFSLAEVLITLGIIGIVAAATIPNLVAEFRAVKYSVQLKKVVSTLSQTARGGLALNGMTFGDAVYPCSSGDAGGQETTDDILTLCALFNDTLAGKTYIADASKLKSEKGGDYIITKASEGSGLDYLTGGVVTGHAYSLADGSLFVFPSDSYNCTKEGTVCVGFIDVNGASLPNKEVTCSDGSANSEDCVVIPRSQHMTDVYPIVFYDGTVKLSTAAGKYVLMQSKYGNVIRDRNNTTTTSQTLESDEP